MNCYGKKPMAVKEQGKLAKIIHGQRQKKKQ